MYDDRKIDDPFTNMDDAISAPTVMSGNKQNFTGKTSKDRIAFYANYSTLHANGGNDLIQADSGDGDDLFWFIKSGSEISIEGGNGSNTYRFDPYYLGGPYHNDIVITDFTKDDTIEYFADYGRVGQERSDGSELDYYYNSDGNLVLYDANWNFFTITLEGITQDNVGEIAEAKYVSTKKTLTLGQALGITLDGGVSINSANTKAKITAKYKKDTFTAADYGTKIKTIDASETSQGIYITANGLANKIVGGKGNDTLYGAKGNDTLTGGAQARRL